MSSHLSGDGEKRAWDSASDTEAPKRLKLENGASPAVEAVNSTSTPSKQPPLSTTQDNGILEQVHAASSTGITNSDSGAAPKDLTAANDASSEAQPEPEKSVEAKEPTEADTVSEPVEEVNKENTPQVDQVVQPEQKESEVQPEQEVQSVEPEQKEQPEKEPEQAMNPEPKDVEMEIGTPSGQDKSETKPEPQQEPQQEKPAELTPLEAAQLAADKYKVELPLDLDPSEPPTEEMRLPKQQHKFLVSAIKNIKRLKDAYPFVEPVDPVRHGVPAYFDYIKEPMDLGTIEKNLMQGDHYQLVGQVVDDFNKIIANCIIFNGEDSQVSQMVVSIAASFKRQLGNMPIYDDPQRSKRTASAALAESMPQVTMDSPKTVGASASNASAVDSPAGSSPGAGPGQLGPGGLTKKMLAPGVPMLRRESNSDRPKREIHHSRARELTTPATGDVRPVKSKQILAELKFASNIVREFMSRKHEAISYPFLRPVDPVAQGVPDYFDVVKEPMDLSAIQSKLAEGLYYDLEEFEADIRLMFRNCYLYNPESSPVNELGHKLETLFDRKLLDKPVPAPTPPPMAGSDEGDYDEEYDEAGITNPAIKVLEEQLASMKRQLHLLKKEALKEWHDKRSKKRGSKASSLLGSARRQTPGVGTSKRKNNGPNNADGGPTVITYEMKKQLSESIGELSAKQLRKVIEIIQESMPQLRTSDEDEIELEMDQLEPETLRQLYNYVVRRVESNDQQQQQQQLQQQQDREPQHKHKSSHARGSSDVATSPQGSNSGGAGTTGNKKKKSKPLSEDEQNRQIEEIQNKLRQFDQHKGDSQSPDAMMGDASRSGDLDDESSSEEDIPGNAVSSDDESSSEEE